jgi:cysteine desulfurase
MPIYLDNNTLTRPDEQVVEAMKPFLGANFHDPLAPYTQANLSRRAYGDAMEKLYAGIHAKKEDDILITSGDTESNNWLFNFFYTRKILTGKGGAIIISERESGAIAAQAAYLESQGAKVFRLGVNKDGVIDPQDLLDYITPRTALVSVTMVDEESGAIQPIEEIAEICAQYEVPFHTDATQAIGKIPVDVQRAPITYMTFSAHTFHGPTGVGALYVRAGAELEPMLMGSSTQMGGKRAGVLNLAGIVGMGKAMEIAVDALEYDVEDMREIRDALEEKVREIPDVTIITPWSLRVPNTLTFAVRGVSAASLLLELNRSAIAATSATLYPQGNWERRSLIDAVGADTALRHTVITLALSRYNTEEEVDEIVKALNESIDLLRDESPVYSESKKEEQA